MPQQMKKAAKKRKTKRTDFTSTDSDIYTSPQSEQFLTQLTQINPIPKMSIQQLHPQQSLNVMPIQENVHQQQSSEPLTLSLQFMQDIRQQLKIIQSQVSEIPAIRSMLNSMTIKMDAIESCCRYLIIRTPDMIADEDELPPIISPHADDQHRDKDKPSRKSSGEASPSCSVQPSTSGYRRHMQFACLMNLTSSDESEDEDLQAAITASLKDSISPIQKESLLENILQELGNKIHGENSNFFNVVRGHLLDGAIRGLKRKNFNATHRISVKFMDDIGVPEGAVDQGGPKREFFTFVMQEIMNSNIFAGPESNKMLIPSHSGAEKDLYFFAGQLISLSLAHGCHVPHCFSDVLYDVMTKGYEASKASITDVHNQDIRNQVQEIINAKSLEELRNSMANASSFLEIAGCYFAVHAVEDKQRVANAAIKFHVIDRARHNIDRFLDGLSTLDVLRYIRENPENMKKLFCFNPEILTSKKLENLFVPCLSEKGTNQVQCEMKTLAFWHEYLQDLEDEDTQATCKDTLLFATGSEEVPPCGFDVQPKLEFTPGFLPMANTCACILKVPLDNTTYELFKVNMDFGILNSPAFGLT